MITVAAVLIGDEILSGKIEETNSRALIETVAAAGASLRRLVVISDEPNDIAAEIRHCSERYDHVVTSGGVGPTHDDRTMEGIARAFGCRVVRDLRLSEIIERHLAARANEAALKMAEVPEGAHLIEAGDFPLVAYANIYILPGVPEIFREKLAYLRERFSDAPTHVARIFLGCYESEVAAELSRFSHRHPEVKIGSYPRMSGEYRVLVTVESQDGKAVDRVVGSLRDALPAEHLLRVCGGEEETG